MGHNQLFVVGSHCSTLPNLLSPRLPLIPVFLLPHLKISIYQSHTPHFNLTSKLYSSISIYFHQSSSPDSCVAFLFPYLLFYFSSLNLFYIYFPTPLLDKNSDEFSILPSEYPMFSLKQPIFQLSYITSVVPGTRQRRPYSRISFAAAFVVCVFSAV